MFSIKTFTICISAHALVGVSGVASFIPFVAMYPLKLLTDFINKIQVVVGCDKQWDVQWSVNWYGMGQLQSTQIRECGGLSKRSAADGSRNGRDDDYTDWNCVFRLWHDVHGAAITETRYARCRHTVRWTLSGNEGSLLSFVVLLLPKLVWLDVAGAMADFVVDDISTTASGWAGLSSGHLVWFLRIEVRCFLLHFWQRPLELYSVTRYLFKLLKGSYLCFITFF